MAWGRAHLHDNTLTGIAADAAIPLAAGFVERAPRAKDFTNQRVRKGGEVDEAERRRNRNTSKIRARVEHVFAVVKRLLWGFAKVRYRGLEKNANRSFVVLGLANLSLARARLAG